MYSELNNFPPLNAATDIPATAAPNIKLSDDDSGVAGDFWDEDDFVLGDEELLEELDELVVVAAGGLLH